METESGVDSDDDIRLEGNNDGKTGKVDEGGANDVDDEVEVEEVEGELRLDGENGFGGTDFFKFDFLVEKDKVEGDEVEMEWWLGEKVFSRVKERVESRRVGTGIA